MKFKDRTLLCSDSCFYTNRKKTAISPFVSHTGTNYLYFLIHSDSGSGNYRDKTEIYCFEHKKQLFKKADHFKKGEYTRCCIICEGEHSYEVQHNTCWDKMMLMLKKDHELTFNNDETRMIWFKKKLKFKQ